MSFIDESEPARQPRAGFDVLVGPAQGMARLLLVRGLLPAADRGWVHYHDGDEIIRVVSGEVEILVGDDRRRCRAGQLAVVPPRVRNGFVVGGSDATVEVVAEQQMGSYFPVVDPDGTRRLVEVHRADVPFDRHPPAGQRHTSPQEILELVRRTAEPLEPR
jgi:quercetin dioxygenase-like cupin family protein